MPQVRILIIGAGPTALGALHRLHHLHHLEGDEFSVRVIEQEYEPGGLARTETDAQGFSWDLGVHVTGTSKYPEFLAAIDSAVPEWRAIQRCVKADMAHVMGVGEDKGITTNPMAVAHRCYVPYPVQNSVPYFPDALKAQCLADLDSITATPTTTPCNFAEFSAALFGPTLQSVFIRPYNEKVWTVGLEELSTRWVEGRVPRIEPEQIRRRCRQSSEEMERESQTEEGIFFRYPAGCRGIGDLWRRFAAQFPQEVFRFGERVAKIDTHRKELWTGPSSGEGPDNSYSYDILISTIPITELCRLAELPQSQCPLLKHSKVVLVGIGLRPPQSPFARRLSWAYYPRPETIFYRCTVLSNFSDELTPPPPINTDDERKYWSVLCEIGRKAGTMISKDEEKAMIDKTVEDLVAVGLIESAAQVCSRWLKVLEHGYPAPTLDRDVELNRAHAHLEGMGIYSRGRWVRGGSWTSLNVRGVSRFGGWRYEISNQDHSFECGLQLVDRLMLGIPETLYLVGEAEAREEEEERE